MATGDRQMRKRSRRRRSRRRAIRQRYGIGLALVLLFLAGGAFAIRRVNDRYAWSRLKESQEATAAEDYGWWGARGQSLSEEGQEIFGEERTPPEVSLEASDYAGWRRLLDENQVSAAFREGAEAFAFDSGSRILRQSEGNVAYSPLSAYQALALAGCGADGETEKEIFRVLKVEDRETLADQCRKLYQQLYYAGQWAQKQSETYGGSGERDQIWLGNALWVSDQVQIDRDYEELAARCFFAPSISIDLEDPKAGEQMSQWIAQKTAGKIHAAPVLGPEDRMVLMDTLYFYGGWRDPFREADTQKDRFTLESGEEVSCLFLNKTIENGSFRKGEGFTVAYLHTADSKVFFRREKTGGAFDHARALKGGYGSGAGRLVCGGSDLEDPQGLLSEQHRSAGLSAGYGPGADVREHGGVRTDRPGTAVDYLDGLEDQYRPGGRRAGRGGLHGPGVESCR